MKIESARFEGSVGTLQQLKPQTLPEIVFSGRSNVGKSSLLNRLLSRKALARVSATPGKTITINFFALDTLKLVDLPGYGYAKRSHSEQDRWSKLVNGYFTTNRPIALVVQLLDMRHAPSAEDRQMIDFLRQSGYPFMLVLTKSDKLNKTEYANRLKAFEEEFSDDDIVFRIEGRRNPGNQKEIRRSGETVPMRFVTRCLDANEKGHLTIGGVDAVDLAQEYGTPLYVFDEQSIRGHCRAFRESIAENYDGNGLAIYASKAFNCLEICKIIRDEGLGLDVVSGGELYTAIKAGFPTERIFFHGNNKSREELKMALEHEIGRIVVDNHTELDMLEQLAGECGKTANVYLRIKPGVDAHTHDFIKTGQIDSKFGFALENGEAMQAVEKLLVQKNLRLCGLHCHIGSQIFEIHPFQLAAEVMLQFMKRIHDELGHEIAELDLGGGFGIRYAEDDDAKLYKTVMKEVSVSIKQFCAQNGMTVPKIMVEPGRAIVGPGGTTLYTVGNVKEIKNVRTFVSVDGGMADNPRYALYQAKYTALIANKALQEASETVTIAGKCCESGDLIQENTALQPAQAGDILAVCCTGAYNYSMSSNYNRIPRPAAIMIRDGKARLIIRRETYEDLLRCDK